MKKDSYIVYELETNKVVLEMRNAFLAARINRKRYGVVTAHTWLSAYNAALALARGLTAKAD